tara:strand:- start:1383 stop:2048 length:666 start_codon:yes stop_codon:yes gene_type:complete
MKCRRFVSAPPQSPYAPQWDFRIGTSLCNDVDTNSLSKFLLKKEKEIKKLPSSRNINGKLTDGFTGLGSNSITAKFQSFNLLTWDHPEIKKLKTNIARNIIQYNSKCGNITPPEIWIQCWYNVLRFGQKIKPHFHSSSHYSYLSGHFNVQTNKTSTCYMSPINQLNDPDVANVKNIPGEMTIFPSYIFHYTTPHYSLRPRITIAFDMVATDQNSNGNWVKI